MKKLKNIAVFILAVGGLFALSIHANYQYKNNFKLSDNTIISTLSVDRLYDYSNPRIIEEHVDDIVLLKIEEVKGVSNSNLTTNENTLPYTFGTANVLSVIKGEINSERIEFARLGGVMNFEDWIKGEDDAEKVIEVMEQNNISLEELKSYKIETKIEKDIEPLEGKYYLAYLSATNDDFGNVDYTIVGGQYGLREIKKDTLLNEANYSDLLVMNNDTNNWEKISDVVTLK
ncbi:MAG: hypothetical protein NC483_01690 [Ruminococcus sp.]|nr:hypothetical protein [Ruminococcus sp.]